MKLIWHYIKRYKFLLFLNLIAVLTYLLTELGIPTIMAEMIDQGVVSGNLDLVKEKGLWILLLSFMGGVGSIVLAYTTSRIASWMTRDIRTDLFAKIQTLSHAEYNQIGVSSLITRVSSDVYQLHIFVQIALRLGIGNPLMLMGSLFFIWQTSTKLALVMALSFPIIIAIIYYVGKKSGPYSTRQQKLLDKMNRITRENITGIRVIRSFRKDEHENERFEEVNKDYADVSKKLMRLMSIAEPLFFFVLNMFVLVIIWVATGMIASNELQVGSLVAFMEYQFLALFSLLLFSNVLIMYPRARVSAQRLEEVFNLVPSVTNDENGIDNNEPITNIQFKDVEFKYPDGINPVLENINFEVVKGETIAFIGSTGSGKSTIIKLLARFYDVTKGEVLINGINIKDYEIHSLRNKMGFVAQKALLFTGSIEENIRYGKQDAIEEEVIESAQNASAHAFIQEKENQYEEWLSEGGSNVSGGQKQRLSIARALVRKPSVYIFDDSFSALDYKTDAQIRKNIQQFKEDSITVIVAQRISSIVSADKIVVLDEGRIVGIGTHNELMKTCEIYIEIARSQFSEEEMSKYEKS